MDDFVPGIDIMVDRALAIANLAATADNIPDGDLRDILKSTMNVLLDSITPKEPEQKSASITRIK